MQSMTAEAFILDELNKLSIGVNNFSSHDVSPLAFRSIMSSKYRRKSVSDALKNRIYDSIVFCTSKRQPINITFLQGSYKLWRFDESPEADWAELFALMHYVSWVKPVLLLYEPGIEFDFFLDDWIMEIISNYRRDEIVSYQSSFKKVIDFVSCFCPQNIKFKITPVSNLYVDEQAFKSQLEQAVANWEKPENITLDSSTREMVDLNYRPFDGETHAPLWQEKIMCFHDAHSAMPRRCNYRDAPGKILAMPFHYTGEDTRIFVGSTKDSNIKYWSGVGALRKRDNSFMTTVLSPKQLSNASCSFELVGLSELSGKNFRKIRILEGS